MATEEMFLQSQLGCGVSSSASEELLFRGLNTPTLPECRRCPYRSLQRPPSLRSRRLWCPAWRMGKTSTLNIQRRACVAHTHKAFGEDSGLHPKTSRSRTHRVL